MLHSFFCVWSSCADFAISTVRLFCSGPSSLSVKCFTVQRLWGASWVEWFNPESWWKLMLIVMVLAVINIHLWTQSSICDTPLTALCRDLLLWRCQQPYFPGGVGEILRGVLSSLHRGKFIIESHDECATAFIVANLNTFILFISVFTAVKVKNSEWFSDWASWVSGTSFRKGKLYCQDFQFQFPFFLILWAW